MDPIQNNNTAFKTRLITASIMLMLGFIGVFITDIKKDGAWHYWQFLAVVYAALSLALNWHLKRKGWKTTLLTIWHEIAHWVGLMAAIFVASYFVSIGLVGRFEASLLTLLLLALATYLAGIYIESTLIFVGIALGVLGACIAFLDAYLYNVLLPITIVTAIILVLMIRYSHKKSTNP